MTYHSIPQDVLDAITRAVDTSITGDVPDISVGIYNSLRMDGFDIVRTEDPRWQPSIYQTMAECDCSRPECVILYRCVALDD
jgi:hypothetical protein